jgi:hypothetical protein
MNDELVRGAEMLLISKSRAPLRAISISESHINIFHLCLVFQTVCDQFFFSRKKNVLACSHEFFSANESGSRLPRRSNHGCLVCDVSVVIPPSYLAKLIRIPFDISLFVGKHRTRHRQVEQSEGEATLIIKTFEVLQGCSCYWGIVLLRGLL